MPDVLEHVLMASEPESFASAMVEAHSDEALWRKLSCNGRASLKGRFTPDVARNALQAAMADVIDR